MKKKIILFLIIMVFPFFVYAQDVDKMTISGSNSAYTNKEISLTFNISFTGIDKKSTDGYGIGGYSYQLEFDDNIFVPISIKKSDYFNTSIYKDEYGKYHVVGTINKNNKSSNKCSDNVLYCNNISDTITFGVKSTKSKKSTIKMFASSSYLYKVGSSLTDTDRMIIDSIKDIQKEITISKSTSKSVNTNNIATNIKTTSIESMIESKVQNYKVVSDSKSNNYLKSLEVDGYPISFDKHLLSYEITVGSYVNSLIVKAEGENEKSTITISGNDDLRKNNYTVSIKVVAEDKSEKIYKINVVKDENEEEQEIETKEDIKKLAKSVKSKINAKTIKILEIIGVCLLGIIAFVVIVKVITNRKLDKKLNDFDKF